MASSPRIRRFRPVYFSLYHPPINRYNTKDNKNIIVVTYMNDLKLIFASNLIRLRRDAGLTQLMLAEKINYSDKSVSKWERGESIPDAYVLKELSELFGVSIDDLLSAHSEWKSDDPDFSTKVEYSQLSIILTAIAGIGTLCFLEFILVWMLVDKLHWIVLFAGIPLSLIALLVMNSIWYKGRHNMYIVMALVLTLFLLGYFTGLMFQYNFWQLLLIIIPAEIIVVLAFHIRPRRQKKAVVTVQEDTGADNG